MGNRNESGYLKRFLDEYPMKKWPAHLDGGRVLNIGSANTKFNVFYEKIFSDRNILGVDLEKTDGVDVVCDITKDCSELKGERFAVAICCSVLEHVEKPWLAAENIQKLLLPFGLLYVTVPWVWRTHKYPKDYWRMSPDAIRSLFPHVKWKRICHSTQLENEFIENESDHDQTAPWRIMHRGRAYIAVQQTHMIGRMS